ncbi:hypothetical protein NMY22_g16840 [Coprinellus aureogranulatus]|nr:hypothetical protein NMY22_g16840 [Coprinellus aureogranulatus]
MGVTMDREDSSPSSSVEESGDDGWVVIREGWGCTEHSRGVPLTTVVAQPTVVANAGRESCAGALRFEGVNNACELENGSEVRPWRFGVINEKNNEAQRKQVDAVQGKWGGMEDEINRKSKRGRETVRTHGVGLTAARKEWAKGYSRRASGVNRWTQSRVVRMGKARRSACHIIPTVNTQRGYRGTLRRGFDRNEVKWPALRLPPRQLVDGPG